MWADISPSMDFRSRLATMSKRDRTILVLLSLVDLFARGGERVGLLGPVVAFVVALLWEVEQSGG